MRDDDAAGQTGAAYPIRAVDRVCDLLDALQRQPATGVSLAALAETVSLPKSSALRYLSALEARNYVERDLSDGTYRLGLAFRPQRFDYLAALREAVLPHLVKLRDRFEETMNFAALDGTEVVHVEVVESARRVRLAASRGERACVHSTASGKVMAAQIPESRLLSILEQAGMPAFTADTITTVDGFLAEVKITAERGYGLDDCENQPDGRCVAVPIDGVAVPAALSLSAPASRFASEDAQRIAHLLRKQMGPLVAAVRDVPH
ncbi:IclR family transcriptional regulator [Dactylosporangium fulvum]|uniref:IclR family transcriptional regulator n=1 Tax=Dactylosporangium fulvum TaxID=53359 RepID=A0ABY5VQ87_9ACTN|nr:IclR family transcriptional regulator [Dactylosporangium fulvum]UWP78976.1 IclR family transcriptional regulator [Dactylosporangium fulvum]